MPSLADIKLRDFVRYTGDGLPGEPVGHPAPTGDPRSGVHNPTKKDLRDVIGGAFDAAAAAEAYAAAASGTPQYASRGIAQATNVPAFANTITVAGVTFVRDVSGTALTTADGAKWTPAGSVTPRHFGAVPFVDTDQSGAFNAMSNWVRTQYDQTAGAFRTAIDLMGLSWRCDSWDLTNIRQPAFAFGNGTIFSRGTGRTVIDCAGTNHARILGELSIEAPDRSAAPAAGLFIGRALFGGVVGPIAPDWAGKVRIDGYFSKAGFINLASEVSHLMMHVTNRHRSLLAACIVHTGHAGTLDDYIGGYASEYATIPPASSGQHSNILHDYGSVVAKRSSDVTLPILGMTKANPVQVTVDATRLAAAEFSNGQVIFFHDHGGMPEIKYRRLKIANLNVGAGTFTLTETDDSPVNGTAFAAWTGGGNMWTSTGPAVIFGPGQSIKTRSAYFLTYGAPSCILDVKNGTISDIDLDFQQEAHPDIPLRIDVGTTNGLIRRLRLNLLSASQSIGVAAIHTVYSGAGTLRLDNPEITLVGRESIPVDSLIGGRGVVTIRNGVFRVPYMADIATTGWASFSGTIHSADPAITVNYGASNAPRTATSAQFTSAASVVNTVGKVQGCAVYDTTTNKMLYANNALATGAWRDAAGTVVYTPA